MFRAMLVKEFLLVSRDKHALAALFIMPAVFILIMSLALKDVMNEEDSVLSYVLIDNAQNKLSESIVEVLSKQSVLQRKEQTANDLSPESNDVQFVVEIPSSFDKDEPTPMSVQVAADTPYSTLALFKNQLALSWMSATLSELKSALSRGVTQNEEEFDSSKIMSVHYSKFSEDKQPTSTQQSVPSWIVFGLYFVVIPMSTIFVSERKQNTMMRLSTMNVSLPVLFTGKILPYMVINQVQVWLMIAVGVYLVPLCGADPLVINGSILGLVIISLCLSLSAIGLSILIATIVDSIEQATTIGGIINILLGAIGGVMVPKFVMPEIMQQLANISPMSWGLEGYLDIFLRGGSVSDVLNESAALLCFGFVSLSLAGVIFNYKKRINS